MYSLDTNFLNDRQVEQLVTKKSSPKKNISLGELLPLFGGIVAGIIPLAVVAGLLLFVNVQKNNANEKLAGLKSELQQLEAQNQRIQQLKQEISQAEGEAQTFASVFNQVKPWSAIMQDLRDRIPAGVQILSLRQSEELPKEAKQAKQNQGEVTAAKDLKPEVTLRIEGIAKSFNEVNDFMLTLQNSRFLKKEKTLIETAELIENPFQLELPETDNSADIEVTLPPVVRYKILATFTEKPASELIRELDRKGAVGLVTRIKTLEDKGIIK